MIERLLRKSQIQIMLLGITIQTAGVQLGASALTLTPTTIIDTWTEGPEVVYGLSSNGGWELITLRLNYLSMLLQIFHNGLGNHLTMIQSDMAP